MQPAVRVSLFYAALFLVVGVQLPFWPLFLAGRGLDAAEIGLILAAGQWSKVAASPAAGALADRIGRRAVLVALAAAALVGYLLFLPVEGFWPVLVLAAATSAASSALFPVGDNLALGIAYASGRDYGRMRLWGSVSFIAAALIGGRVIAGRPPELVLDLVIAAALLLLLACLALPDAAGPRIAPRRGGWRSLLADRRFLLFLAGGTLVQSGHMVYYGFGTLHWERLGYSSATIGALFAEGVVAEIVLFALSGRIMARIAPAPLLAVAGLAGVVRWTGTAFAEALPALALLQALHALTFGAAHLAAMHFIARTVPAELSATGQALYSALSSGVGFGLAMALAGALFEAHGALAYLGMAALTGAGAVFAGALMRVRIR